MFLIQLLLPTSSPGIPTADVTAALAQVRQDLAARFNGATAYVRSPAEGLWNAPDGEVEQDDVVMVEVVTIELDRQWWNSYADVLATRFHQKVVHIRAMPVAWTSGESSL